MDSIFDSFLLGDVFRKFTLPFSVIFLVETPPVVFKEPSELATDIEKWEFTEMNRIF